MLKKYAIGVCTLFVLLFLLTAGIFRGRTLFRTAFDGRKAKEETEFSRFDLQADMIKRQTQPRISGWLSVVSSESVAVRSERGVLRGTVFSPLSGEENAPWAILFHGGAGTDREQMLDVACELSLAGYRVLTPDLYAHGNSDGEWTSFGSADAQDVFAWVEWVRGEELGARIVLMGQDEGALAVLMAQQEGLEVEAAVLDSPTLDVVQKAKEGLANAGEELGGADEFLLSAAYRFAFGEKLESFSAASFSGSSVPTLFFAGTLDEESPAYDAQDLASALGGELCLIEGATHGMARYAQPEQYYEKLLAFFNERL